MLKKKSTYITVRFQKEGIHRYPAALTDPSLESVRFLGHDHRHLFYFEVSIEVFHDDRDLEFIMVKREIESWYNQDVLQLDYKSCEMMSDDLAGKIAERWPGRNVEISIFEDNENGSTSFYEWVD